jgi:glutaconate CoA-transferase subunit A
MGCAARCIFSWGGNPGVGSIHRFRDAIENGWPHPLAIEEHSHADMAGRYQAGASGLPFSVLRGYVGSDLPRHNTNICSITCPFTGEKLAATPAINPDVAVIHAQKADRAGNVLVSGIVGIQKEAVLAAKAAIVTVEEIVDDLAAPMNACVLPHWVLAAVCVVPNGAHPSYAHGYYGRDNAFCKAWDAISRDRDTFLAWMKQHVLGTKDHAEFLRSIGVSKMVSGTISA